MKGRVDSNPRFIYPAWPAPAQVRAVSTTRLGGFSAPPYDGLNLGDHVGDDPACVAANRASIAQTLNLPGEPAWLTQVHGNNVIAAENAPATADAAYTRKPHQICVVQTADCLPVLLCDQMGTVVAAVHCGWRGLVQGALETTLTAMSCDSSEILAWLGPAIGPNVFEVGEEVKLAFCELNPAYATCFHPSPAGRWLADIYYLARLQLQSLGVNAIHGGEWCTFSESDRFFSYRRSHPTGRMASFIWLNA
ncbi:MAG: peptidoglycan editing factor PgeF [Candidatus Competibacteraceae bacterium]|nr:peptidoglycan editing factor PgeF [Candidatus Competibacteraceae bacterium]